MKEYLQEGKWILLVNANMDNRLANVIYAWAKEKKNHIRSQPLQKRHLAKFSNFFTIKILDKRETRPYLNIIDSAYKNYTGNVSNSWLLKIFPLREGTR